MQDISDHPCFGFDHGSGDLVDWRSIADAGAYRDLAMGLFNLSLACVKLFDSSGRLLAINKRGREFYGRKHLSSLTGLHISKFIDPRYCALCLEHFNRAARGETTSFLVDGPPSNGQRRTWRVSMHPVRNDVDKAEFVLTCAYDIAPASDDSEILRELENQKRLNESLSAQLEANARLLASARDQATHAERFQLVGQFLAHVIHDMNNVLAMMQGMVRLLRRPVEVRKDVFEQVEQSIERGRRLVRSLLDLSRKDKPSPEIFDPAKALSEISGLIESLAGPGARLSYDVQPEAGTIFAGRYQFEVALFNLVSNARDASGDAPEISLRVEGWRQTEDTAQLAAADYVKVSVADKGCGMSPAVLSRMGEPYYTTKHPGKGTGLGLASVFEFVQNCGGRIHFESQLGEGSQVSLYIPRAPNTLPCGSGAQKKIPVSNEATISSH